MQSTSLEPTHLKGRAVSSGWWINGLIVAKVGVLLSVSLSFSFGDVKGIKSV